MSHGVRTAKFLLLDGLIDTVGLDDQSNWMVSSFSNFRQLADLNKMVSSLILSFFTFYIF